MSISSEKPAGFIAAIRMIVLGVLGAANLMIARKPDTKEMIGKLALYLGTLGLIANAPGLWGPIASLTWSVA